MMIIINNGSKLNKDNRCIFCWREERTDITGFNVWNVLLIVRIISGIEAVSNYIGTHALKANYKVTGRDL